MTLDGFEHDKAARIVAVDWAVLAEDEGKRLKALGVAHLDKVGPPSDCLIRSDLT